MSDSYDHGSDYTFADVRIDSGNFNVVCGDEVRNLTPRAFDVLVFLIENRGRVVEKQELFEAIWKESFVTDSALTRAIKEIRRVLGDEASAPRYIETVHKRGYRFVGELYPPPPNAHPAELAGVPGFSGLQVSDYASQAAAPETSTTDQSSTRRESRQPITKGILAIAFALGACLIAAAGVWFFSISEARGISTIAVLPFANETHAVDLDYLADGMTETLISNLSQLPGLTVKARSTVFRYKGRESEARTIAANLGVQAIVTGRVVQRADEITIFLSLVDAGSGNNLWSHQYDRKMTNLVSLQNEIAHDVASRLLTKLSASGENAFAKQQTENSEAYQLYLKGRFHVLSTRQNGPEAGIAYYRRAIGLDPNYALAHAALAEAWLGLAFRNEALANDVFPQARASAMRAVEIDPALADAQIALAQTSFWYDWNWTDAENKLRQALMVDPNNAEAHLVYGALLFNIDRRSESIAHLQRSIALEPLNLRNKVVYAQYLNFAGEPGEGLRVVKEVLELEPNFYLAHLTASQAYIELKLYHDAAESARHAQRLNTIDSTPAAFLGVAFAKLGREREAHAVLDELLTKQRGLQTVTPYNIAFLHNALNNTDAALVWLQQGLNQRDLRMAFLAAEPKWNNLRENRRFQDISRRVGLTK